MASANGSMGLALEMFEYRTWIVYVLVMLALEAWLIGRPLGLSWAKSAGIAVLANAVTAFACPCCLTPALHGALVGSSLLPNPFWNAVSLLFWFALISALLESAFWITAGKQAGWMRALGLTFWAHLLAVPVALAILLIPSRPYKGLESIARARRRRVRIEVAKRIGQDLSEGRSIPKAKSAEDLFQHYADVTAWGATPETIWSAAYAPRFGRFATGEDRSEPIEVNPEVIGKSAKELPSETWLMRWKYLDGWVEGIVVRTTPDPNHPYCETALKQNPKQLGY